MKKIAWKKCPSVTTGGKPFFYTAVIPAGKTWDSVRVWVVWCRRHEKWTIETSNDTSMGMFPRLFDSHQTAMKEFEKRLTA